MCRREGNRHRGRDGVLAPLLPLQIERVEHQQEPFSRASNLEIDRAGEGVVAVARTYWAASLKRAEPAMRRSSSLQHRRELRPCEPPTDARDGQWQRFPHHVKWQAAEHGVLAVLR